MGEDGMKPSEAIKEQTESLKDIGLGVNSVANRLVSVGIVGVFVVLFVFACYAFWSLLKDEMTTNRDAAKMFMNDLKVERERQDLRWLNARDRNDAKHNEVIGSLRETQKVIQDGQKSIDRVVGAVEQAVKIMAKKME